MAPASLHHFACNFVQAWISDVSNASVFCSSSGASVKSCHSQRLVASLCQLQESGAVEPLYVIKNKKVKPVMMVEATISIEPRITSDSPMDPSPEEALALARTAFQAVRDAAALASCSSLNESTIGFPTETDKLRLERARLTATESEKTLNTENGEETWVNQKDVYSSSSLPENSHFMDGNQPLQDNTEGSHQQKREAIAAKSGRRGGRLAKRARASAKSGQLAASMVAAAATSPPIQSRPNKASVQNVSSDPIWSFLVKNGSISSNLLTVAEEVELSRKVQDLLRLEAVKETVQEQIGRDATLAEWAKAVEMEIGAFSVRVNEGRQSKDRLIKSNLRLVVSVARRHLGRGVCVQDLIQEGYMGLIRGCEKFDPEKGFRFSTYAHWWIRKAVTSAISEQSHTVRLPAHFFEIMSRIKTAKRTISQEYGHPPLEGDVAKALRLSVEKLRSIARLSKHCKSLEKPVGNDLSTTLGELIEDEASEHPELTLAREFFKQDLKEVLMTLSLKEQEVVKLRYGLEDGRMKTLEEVGSRLSITRERVRQIESRAMRKLRQPHSSEALEGYLYVN